MAGIGYILQSKVGPCQITRKEIWYSKYVEIIFIFLVGTAIGSFLNVLVDRLPRGEGVFGGRSHCDKCKKDLAWYDLIPLFSFLILRGKCRYCHTPLSLYYPVVELTTGILFVLVFVFLGARIMNQELRILDYITLVYYFIIISSLIVVFFTDLKYGIIPDAIVAPSIFVSFPYLFFNHYSLILNHLLSGGGAFLFFLFLFLITKGRGMGFGDVKLSFLLGLVLGFPKIAVALYISFLTGAIVGCILIIWKRKRLHGTKIPFGPFLVFGTLLTIFLGEQIMQIMLGFLFPI
ncbi:MAG: prepilin peptidase [Candidatus Levybacteria bacterium]|nr:prepilin peptidase [Candidatus Levybacteria bacterium]